MNTNQLKKAIIKLAESNVKYEQACIKKYGRYKDDNDLYCSLTGDAWHNYLEAGGSRTMINQFLHKEDDFGAVQQRLNKECV